MLNVLFVGENKDIFFPKLSEELHLITFYGNCSKIFERVRFQAHECSSEEEAKNIKKPLPQEGKYLFFLSK